MFKSTKIEVEAVGKLYSPKMNFNLCGFNSPPLGA
jgi:hypothetical protein